MSFLDTMVNAIPVAPLKVCALPGCEDKAKNIENYLVDLQSRLLEKRPASELNLHYNTDSFIIDCECPRFGSGEAKGIIKQSVRGADLYILADVCNYSVKYKMHGFENRLSPDDHFQNLKRIIAACMGKAHRINVVMPFLYESRQHKRSGRESLDSALALKELTDMGVSNIITFDTHDPKIVNAVPLHGFDNFYPSYQFCQALFKRVPDLKVDSEHLMTISPDEGAMSRAKYFANILGVDMGMFYKRRDYSRVVNGKNPIVAHEFLGASLKDKDVIVLDDMIASGESMLHVAAQLKDRGARRVFVCTTFGLFTEGLEAFDKYYEDGLFDLIITTDLTYQSPDLLSRPWYESAKLDKYIANIIYATNHDVSLEPIIDNTSKINGLLKRYHNA
jgi:ribose-phosphate pyrophosphokinase